MNVDVIRFVDRFAGTPLCWILTAIHYFSIPFRRKQKAKRPKRVLILKLAEMGSTVLAYPAIAELKEQTPDIELFFVTFEKHRDIIDELRLTAPSNIFTINVSSAIGFLKSAFLVISQLIRKDIDTTIDMDFFSRFTMIIAFLICRDNRVGFYKFNSEGLSRGRLLTHNVAYSAHVHTSVAFMALTRTISRNKRGNLYYKDSIAPADISPPIYKKSKENTASITAMLSSLKINITKKTGNLVIVNANSSQLFPLRRWPISNFIELCIRLLKEDSSMHIILTGTANEKEETDELLKIINNDHCISLVGMTSFSELMALFSMSNLLITNDSGPAHFASLHKLPIIDIFGPETPELYKPLGKYCKCIYSNYTCSPCVSVYNNKKSACKENLCLQAITVDEVLQEALLILSKKTPNQVQP